MKRWLLVLGMITCILGVSACGSKQEEEPAWTEMTEEEAIYYGEQIFQNLREICSGNYENEKAQIAKADAVSASAFSSWDSAQEDIGEFVEILEENAQINDDGFIVNLKIKGTVHDANIEIIFDDEMLLTSMSTNVVYSFGELMAKAAMNTLLGMGTVFVVLILISLIISCFTFIPKIQASFTKKPQQPQQPVAAPAPVAVAAVEEEEADDLELVAVIAAAIAASQGAASTDGFVVRSIRKRRTF
ncbi:MAG: OadG family protein [Lachnospiraceae bacterium]|jgi:sodium pump decarboxylase gamma subunit|nr:OadG family protein [Lachnospiraceae bacterium]